ncbi:MAG: hypothetical protein ABIA04_00760 [Pseudomonadota bacterium]
MIPYYIRMLNDENRINHFKKAIFECVKEGDVVVEIGSGLGTYSFFAALAGASKVYAIEETAIIEDSKSLAMENGLIDKIEFIKADSTKVSLPEKADVLIFEDFSASFITSRCNKIIVDAKARLLKENAKILPFCSELYLSLLKSEKIYKELSLKNEGDLYGLDFSSLFKKGMNNWYVEKLESKDILSESKLLRSFDFYIDNDFSFNEDLSFQLESCEIFGITSWFDLKITDQVFLSNYPSSLPTVWGQAIFPFEKPVKINESQKITLSMCNQQNVEMTEQYFSWSLKVGDVCYNGSTFKGFSLDVESLVMK